MKKFLVAITFGLMSLVAHAEASFDQIQGLIQQGQYQAAEQGLEVIIKNHPQSAKAFYAMAQAQAGLGNLEKAKKALDIATGLNPTLDFAPASSVASLREAITPQTKKIEAVETSHFWVNFAYFALFCGFAVACYFLYSVYARKREEDEAALKAKQEQWAKELKEAEALHESVKASRQAEKEATAAKAKAAREYVPPVPEYREPVSSRTVTPAPQPTTTVVNNTSSSNDLLTGVILGNMMSNHHETTRVVEREVVRETPAPKRDSSWDSDSSSSSSSSSRSSSWDDDSSSSSKRSSSWDDSSSSSSSSSWSSSSDSSSSSSWDSGSSSSSSSDW